MDTTATRKPFTWPDLVVLVVFECVAVPICIAAGDAFVKAEFGRAAFGWAVGVPTAVAGFTAHWWKAWLSEDAREGIARVAASWAPIAVAVAFLYVVGPNIYQRATMLPSAETAAKTDSPAQVPIAISAIEPPLLEVPAVEWDGHSPIMISGTWGKSARDIRIFIVWFNIGSNSARDLSLNPVLTASSPKLLITLREELQLGNDSNYQLALSPKEKHLISIR
jgi:hypothetical protein